MAGHTVGCPRERAWLQHTLRSVIAMFGFSLCIGTWGRVVSSEPLQWKQSIERPHRDWDYDGKRILGHIGYDVCLWNAMSGKLLQRMKSHKEYILAVQFSPDGNHALSSSWIGSGGMSMMISRDTRVILWNLGTGRERDCFPNQVAGEFCPDGTRIVTFSARAGKVETTYEYTNPETGESRQQTSTVTVTRFDYAAVWETYTGRQLVKAKLDEDVDPKSETLHFSPDGRRFVLLQNGGFLPYNSSGGILFDTKDGRELGRIAGEDVKFGNGHRYTSRGALATFEPTTIRQIDFESGREIQRMPHDLKSDFSAGFSVWGTLWTHDGGKAAAIPSRGNAIRILDIERGKVTTGAKTHPAGPGRAVVSPDNSRLAIQSGSNAEDDPQVRLYATNTGEEIARIKLPKCGGIIGFSPDSETLLIGGSQYTEYIAENEEVTMFPEFAIYNSDSGERIRTLKLLDEVN